MRLGIVNFGLGLTPAANRSVKPIPTALLALVPKPTDGNTTILSSDPDVVSETLPTIMSKVKRTLYQTKKLAAAIQGSSLQETLRNDSKFVLDYIKYKLDDSANEEIRSPRRTIHDATGDCDCMATLLGSFLMNQKIAFKFRIAKYKAGSDWSHIYIVVPKDQSNKKELSNRADYYVLDPVTNKHDYEVPPKEFKDFTMGLKYLDGFGAGNLNGMGCGCGCDSASKCDNTPTIKKLRHFIDSQYVIADGKVPTRVFLMDCKIPFESKVENNVGYFIVMSAQGPLRVSPVITQAEAETLKLVCTQRTAPIAPTREELLAKLTAQSAAVRINGDMVLPYSENVILTTPFGDGKNMLVTTAIGQQISQAQIVKEPAPAPLAVVTPSPVANTATTTVKKEDACAVKEGYNWMALLTSAGIALMSMPKVGGVGSLSGAPSAKRKAAKREAVPTMKM